MYGMFGYILLLIFEISLLHGPSKCLEIRCDQYKRSLTGKVTQNQQEFMNCFGKNVESGQAELIVLVDDSGSMGKDGFGIAKKFIKALLSEVRVSFNATRIAIGTFSDNSKIDINYILKAKYGNNKCKFREEFQNVIFTGGATNIRGSLNDAYKLFLELDSNPHEHSRRQRSNKVVIVISDGYGNRYNGKWDPVEGQKADIEAAKIKRTGYVEIYSIAVTPQSDVDMLKAIASHKSLYLYFKEFDDLGNLAHNIRGGMIKNYSDFLVLLLRIRLKS